MINDSFVIFYLLLKLWFLNLMRWLNFNSCNHILLLLSIVESFQKLPETIKSFCLIEQLLMHVV